MLAGVRVALALVAILACGIGPSAAVAGTSRATPVSPADAAATRAYLEARYGLELSLVGKAAASRAAVTAFDAQLGGECSGVLAHEPRPGSLLGAKEQPPPRVQGELARGQEQSAAIEEELSLTSFVAVYAPDLAAEQAYEAALAPLRWSDPRIAPLVESSQRIWTVPYTRGAASVCADMKVWAQSGYRSLAAATRELRSGLAAILESGLADESLAKLLEPFEDAGDHRLLNRSEALEARFLEALAGNSRPYNLLERKLGIPSNPLEEHEEGAVLGRGPTRAGVTFIVRGATKGEAVRISCRRYVSVEFSERQKGLVIVGPSGERVCLSPGSDERPALECESERESIMAVVPASVRTVVLRLRDGRAISSRVIRIPRTAGGPAGVYVQAIRNSSSRPVSLTELDGSGGVVGMLKLPAHRCASSLPREQRKFVKLATGTAPDGETFTIEGGRQPAIRGGVSFSVLLNPGLTSESGLDTIGESAPPQPRAFARSLHLQCPPHELAVVYGILAAPGASVLARTPAGLVELTNVPLAADLHSGGPLVYGAFASLPSELIVRSANGTTLYSESLAAIDREQSEYCEGYAEA